MTFDAGGTIVFSYTDGTDRWELRVPCAEFDPVTFAYTGTGLKVPTEAGIAATVANFGGVWAPYFDPSWTLTLEALFHTSGDTGTRLATLPSVADVTGTSSTPSSANPPLMRGFQFTLANGRRHVVRFFSVATTTTGARREVTATSGGFDSRDQALMAYLAGPSTGLVAWDGQIFPPTASAYQRYKLAPFERGGGGGGSSPPADCITFPRGATICNDAADVVHVRTPGATHALDLTGYQLPGDGRLESVPGVYNLADTFARPDQSGFGTASDGHTWSRFPAGLIDPNASDPAGALAVQGNEGLLRFIVGSNQLAPILGPPLASADCELLVRWQATVTEISGDTLDTIQLGMLARLSDYDHGVLFLMAGWTHSGGTPDPVVQVIDAPDYPVTQSPQNVSPIVGGQHYWTRWRMVGPAYRWRTWLDGASEPTAWDGTWTDTGWPESGMTGTSVGLFLYPRGNISLVAQVDHFSATTIGSHGSIRLLGPDAITRWEHDGHTYRVTSDGADVLVTPLANLTDAPATLVGRDPATGLPAFCPPPPVVQITPAPNAPQTPPVVPPDHFRCGIAQYVTAQMAVAYSVAQAKVVSLNTTENTLVALGGPLAATILGLLDVVFPPLLIVTAFAIPFIVLLANYQESATLLPLGGPAQDAIARSLYCALQADAAGQYPINGTTLFNWSYNLTNFGSSFSGNQLAEVRLLITVYQQEYWHNLALQAGQQGSTLCAGYDCTGLLP